MPTSRLTASGIVENRKNRDKSPDPDAAIFQSNTRPGPGMPGIAIAGRNRVVAGYPSFLHAFHLKFTINANFVYIPVEATFSMSVLCPNHHGQYF